MEIRFSAEMSLVLKQVTSFLEQSAASSEAAALADQERQFRNRAHENTISVGSLNLKNRINKLVDS